MKRLSRAFSRAGLAAAAAFFLAGCGDDGDGFDYGDNDKNLVACVGDSLTQGYNCIGDPYPTRLARMSGKTVLNYGVGGAKSEYGAGIIGSVLARKPGSVCVMFGSNDAIHGRDRAATKEYLRSIVSACRANKSRVVLAVPPPMAGGHAKFNHRVRFQAEALRDLAKEEHIPLIDFYKLFEKEPERYLNMSDGLHLSDEGGEFIAKKFNSKI